jgi:hypothetical protein
MSMLRPTRRSSWDIGQSSRRTHFQCYRVLTYHFVLFGVNEWLQWMSFGLCSQFNQSVESSWHFPPSAKQGSAKPRVVRRVACSLELNFLAAGASSSSSFSNTTPVVEPPNSHHPLPDTLLPP